MFNSFKMFFIVGRGRSGTSLLVSMLDQHSKIVIPPEAVFIMLLYSKYSKNKKLKKEKIFSFYNDIWIERWLEKWDLNKNELKKDFLSLPENASFNDLCKIIYYNYAKKRKKDGDYIIGDKNPQYSLFLKELILLFPEAKFIHIIRDYRDNILSFKKVRFDLKFTTALAYRWVRYNKDILKMKNKYPEKFISVQYEQLLKEPKQELIKICDFLSIKYNPIMLEYYKNQNDCIPVFHKNLKKPILKKNSNKWKKKMDKDDIKKADCICYNLAKEFGYNSSSIKVNVFLLIISLFGIIYGWFSILFEKKFFSLPLFISKKIMDSYRRMVHQSKDYI